MGVTPSAQDEQMMDEIMRPGFGYYVRLIANKVGDVRLDLYIENPKLQFINVPWSISEEELGEEQALQELLTEIEDKVSPITLKPTVNSGGTAAPRFLQLTETNERSITDREKEILAITRGRLFLQDEKEAKEVEARIAAS